MRHIFFRPETVAETLSAASHSIKLKYYCYCYCYCYFYCYCYCYCYYYYYYYCYYCSSGNSSHSQRGSVNKVNSLAPYGLNPVHVILTSMNMHTSKILAFNTAVDVF